MDFTDGAEPIPHEVQSIEGVSSESTVSFFAKPKRRLPKKDVHRKYVAEKRRLAHKAKFNDCKCRRKCTSSISRDERCAINKAFWSLTQAQQRCFIREFVKTTEIIRRRRTMHNNQIRKQHSYAFQLRLASGTMISVCRKIFMNTLGYDQHCG